MAGESHDFESESKKGEPNLPASSRPRKVKVISCPRCGGSVTIRNPGASLSVVCQSCKAVLDAQDANFRIIDSCADARRGQEPLIAFGTRGTLFGKLWECIGFCVRRDGAYYWEEYLLFNPYYGYRWLVNLSGHWNFVRPIKDVPDDSNAKSVLLDGKKYTLFNRGSAVYEFVLGEFYWNLHVETSVEMSDYINPPYMLSSEKDKLEINWSIGEYVEADDVAKAFKIKGFRKPSGVGANQLTHSQRTLASMKKVWLIFAGLLTCAQILTCFMSSNKIADAEEISFEVNKKGSQTSRVFQLDKDKANVDLYFLAPVDNSWFWVSGVLVNNDTGVSYPFEKSIEYYHGYSDGESWSEGSRSEELGFSNVPSGKYYVSLDYESGAFTDSGTRAVSMIVKRDVPDFSNYWISLILISIFPMFYSFAVYNDNVKRWSQSDFTPSIYQSGES